MFSMLQDQEAQALQSPIFSIKCMPNCILFIRDDDLSLIIELISGRCLHNEFYLILYFGEKMISIGLFSDKSSTDFLIIFSYLRKCWKGLLYQTFPAFCVSEDTPHIMAFRSLIWHWKVVKP